MFKSLLFLSDSLSCVVFILDLQNDEIEKFSLERSSLYRKCRLEEIKLPLLSGNLKHVPMEEVPRLLVYSQLLY